MADKTQTWTPIAATGAVVSAMAIATPGVNFTFTPTLPYGANVSQSAPMTSQDHALLEAKFEAKLAEQKGDLRLNTQSLTDLKERFTDLSAKMATVPADVAAMKRDIAHLPTKDELGAKLRNYLGLAVAAVGLMIALATFIIKNLSAAGGAAT